MVNSTKVTAQIAEPKRITAYYSIFLNGLATIIKSYGAKIVKNAGDALIFYFPETSDPQNQAAFQNVLRCIDTIMASRDLFNIKLGSMDLPSVNYRLSADYGRVEVAYSTSSGNEDLLGPTMNTCQKINRMAEPNGIVIGGDLYCMLKSFSFFQDEYESVEVTTGEGKEKEYGLHVSTNNIGIKYQYPVYALVAKNRAAAPKTENSIHSIIEDMVSKKRYDNNGSSTTSIIHPPSFLQQTPPIILEVDEHMKKSVTGKTKITTEGLPMESSEDVKKKHEQSQPPHVTHVLLVDDEPDVLLTYRTFLAIEGYAVDAFSDPMEALEYFAKLSPHYYDLIIVDIRMPDLNGLQLYQRLKGINADTKVLFLTALDLASELTSVLPNVKRDEILKKPVDREHFVNIVKANL